MAEVLIGLLGMGYAALVGWFIKGWLTLPSFHLNPEKSCEPDQLFFSVVIAARNEAAHIPELLQSLAAQELSFKAFEVLVVDDASTDATANRVKAAQKACPGLRLRLLRAPAPPYNNFVAYKKYAIQHGIQHAKSPWMVTTDADCRVPPYWLYTLYQYICAQQPYMISGPVQYRPLSRLFEGAQALEFMALIGIGAASIHQDQPNMCNGANLAYKRSLFYQVEGFEGVDQIASGDDEFLMHKVHHQFPGKVHFLKHQAAVVDTRPLADPIAFIQQRKRWASKGAYYQSWKTRLLTSFVGGYHLLLIGLLLYPGTLELYGIGMSLKLLPELLFLVVLSPFFGNSRWLPLYPLAALIYPFYVAGVGIYSQFGSYQWKGRALR